MGKQRAIRDCEYYYDRGLLHWRRALSHSWIVGDLLTMATV
jgi:hypothetical protein